MGQEKSQIPPKILVVVQFEVSIHRLRDERLPKGPQFHPHHAKVARGGGPTQANRWTLTLLVCQFSQTDPLPEIPTLSVSKGTDRHCYERSQASILKLFMRHPGN